jgi:hypothetical protein
VKEIPLPDVLELEEGDDLFGEDEEVRGLLGALALDEPEEEGDAGTPDEDDEDAAVAEVDEPTPEDLLADDDDDEVLEIETDAPSVPEIPKGFVAEPDE